MLVPQKYIYCFLIAYKSTFKWLNSGYDFLRSCSINLFILLSESVHLSTAPALSAALEPVQGYEKDFNKSKCGR